MSSRVIDDFEFVWMLRGQARFIAGKEELLLAPGLLLLVPAGVRHEFEWDRRRPSRHGYVHFDPINLGERPIGEVRLRPMTRHDPLSGLCSYLLWLASHDMDGWQQRADRTLAFLLELFLSGPLPPTEPAPTLPPSVSAAIAHLQHEWSAMPLRRIAVTELAAAASLSRGYLNRLFQSGFGVSVATGLEHLRCSRAEALLTRTDLAIEVVAYQCGFADLSHLSHRFGSIHGMSPRAYRRAGAQAPSVLDHPGVRRLSHLVWD